MSKAKGGGSDTVKVCYAGTIPYSSVNSHAYHIQVSLVFAAALSSNCCCALITSLIIYGLNRLQSGSDRSVSVRRMLAARALSRWREIQPLSSVSPISQETTLIPAIPITDPVSFSIPTYNISVRYSFDDFCVGDWFDFFRDIISTVDILTVRPRSTRPNWDQAAADIRI